MREEHQSKQHVGDGMVDGEGYKKQHFHILIIERIIGMATCTFTLILRDKRLWLASVVLRIHLLKADKLN